jgi:hypothetical protein
LNKLILKLIEDNFKTSDIFYEKNESNHDDKMTADINKFTDYLRVELDKSIIKTPILNSSISMCLEKKQVQSNVNFSIINNFN